MRYLRLLADRIEVQLLSVTAACSETCGVTNRSSCFEQVTGIFVELEFGCRDDRTNKTGVAHLTAANGDVLTSAVRDVERSSQGRGGARGGSSA